MVNLEILKKKGDGVMLEMHLDKGLRYYIVKTARKHYWRVASWYELEDLIQDGYLVACKCETRYNSANAIPGGKDDRRQFMAFFCRAFDNHITDLSKSRTRTQESSFASINVETSDHAEAISAPEFEHSTVTAMLALAPDHIRTHIARILTSNSPMRSTRLRKIKVGDRERVVRRRCPQRETSEQWLERVTGQPDVVTILRSYFLGIGELKPA